MRKYPIDECASPIPDSAEALGTVNDPVSEGPLTILRTEGPNVVVQGSQPGAPERRYDVETGSFG